MATTEDFNKLAVCAGKVVKVEDSPKVRKLSYELQEDLGKELGIRRSCAQLSQNYSKEESEGRLVAAVANLPLRQIGLVASKVLTLGFPDNGIDVGFILPMRDIQLDGRIYW